MPSLPILYSFRRCPYAMRARLALAYAGIEKEHREILLRDKPTEMLEASPKGTVPVLVLPNGEVIDESLDIMQWALNQNDPDGWLDDYDQDLIHDNDTWFKKALDRYKYPDRYPNEDCSTSFETALELLEKMETYIQNRPQPTLTDYATMPFIRQFSKVDQNKFDALPYSNVKTWLEKHLNSELFISIMHKHQVWKS